MKTLKLTDNSKTKFKKRHYNTFGLAYGLPENGGTCPGATQGKGGCLDVRDGKQRATCYMAKITSIYKAVGTVLEANTNEVRGKSYEEIVEVLTNTVNQFIKKTGDQDLFFRLHYSGDFFSEEYSKAWAFVMKKFPQVRFWAYTRSHYKDNKLDESIVRHLLEVPNLTLFLSTDPVNKDASYALYNKNQDNKNLAMAWLGNTAPDDGLRWVTCPETSGKVKNTDDAGACSKCRLCVDRIGNKARNIKFNIH